MRKALAELKGAARQNGAGQNGARPAATPLQSPGKADSLAAPAASDQELTAAQRLVAEQRKAAEALLFEAYVLEERLKNEAQATEAVTQCKAAKEKAAALATQEQQAEQLARSASERHKTLAAKRLDADNLVAKTRADAEAAKNEIAQLQQRLRGTRLSAEQLLASISQHEKLAKECAEKEAAAQGEAAEATARVGACQAAWETAENESKAAQERADAFKGALPATTQNLAGINDVENLAARIAEQAGELRRGSLKTNPA
ncbi:MAG: hypothetical protein ABI231_11280 [Candidatus Tumulicola sp.]